VASRSIPETPLDLAKVPADEGFIALESPSPLEWHFLVDDGSEGWKRASARVIALQWEQLINMGVPCLAIIKYLIGPDGLQATVPIPWPAGVPYPAMIRDGDLYEDKEAGRFLRCIWAFMTQEILMLDQVAPPRAARRRAEKAGRPAKDVRVILLRKLVHAPRAWSRRIHRTRMVVPVARVGTLAQAVVCVA
jgi:hypothetical protein